ncbi:transcriptional regulator [Formosimonas limnophila]|uniref:Transcriptional regulator n=1 Tax=Formosimonas limnophila TaxID=1384487 RepID=A0A8J3CNP1_9BURK|nr:LysR family transcriptional regulator [Formosimonas limnophila]GHA78953.1 transcriptional regulator [Formosimonas limnophila]
MSKLNLDAISVIDAIDRYGSFSAAAEHLSKVPSAISYTVNKLEEQLGISLFERNGSRASLTPAGLELLREGRFLLRVAQDLEGRLQSIATGFESELRISIDSIVPIETLIPLIATFEALNCGTRLRLSHEVMSGAWEALRDNRADLIIVGGEVHSWAHSMGYQTATLASIPFAFCVAPTHTLTQTQRTLTPNDLREHTAIVVADSARSLPTRTARLLSGQKHITVPNIDCKIALQIAGLGHGFLPRATAQAALNDGSLVELPVEQTRENETLYLAWRSATAGRAMAWWREQFKQISPQHWL